MSMYACDFQLDSPLNVGEEIIDGILEEIGFVSVNESEVDDDDGVSTEHTHSPTLASLGCRLRGGGTFEH